MLTEARWTDGQVKAFAHMAAQDGHIDLRRYRWTSTLLFDRVDLTDRTILEIGSGRGLRSVFMGLEGARRVVSMEPGLAGSRSNAKTLQRERLNRLGLHNVEFVDADFNTWDAGSARFDIIVSEASINHLYESPRHALRHEETYRRYRQICGKMRDLLAPGGVACVSDACRYGFFTLLKPLGIPRPWSRKRTSVNWRIHQNPGVWRHIMLDAGFTDVNVTYPLPYHLRHFGSGVANRWANFLLKAHFYLQARR